MRTKHLYSGLIMAAAALLCLAGCKKDEGEKITLGTQFEKAASNQKTYLGDGNVLCWSANDSVFVNGVKYKGISSEGIAVTEDEHYYAVYPATTGNSVDANGGTVEIPASQIFHTENGKQVIDGPMAARLDASSGILYFKNLYSLLKVTVSADDKDFTVNTITVTATGDNARALAGTYDFSFRGATTEDPNTAPNVGDIASGSSKVTLKNIATEVSAGEDKDFYLAVHPFAGQNLKVEVHGILDGSRSVVYTHTTATTIGLSRSRIGGLGINLQQLHPEPVIFKFSVSETQQVEFSPGNLQWSATNGGSTATTHAVAGGGTAVGTWRFAEHQYDYIGSANSNISASYTGWIDLFGWGTSGWNSSATAYQPYANSISDADYYPGNTSTNDLTGSCANADWGVYNAIYNPQTGQMDAAGTWRTMTKDEWAYLLGINGNGRSNGHPDWWIFNMVKITDGEARDVRGAIIYPDGVTEKPAGVSASLTKENSTQNTAIIEINEDDFVKLEVAGCVFLPAAGFRKDGSNTTAGGVCTYWSSTHYGATSAHNCRFVFYSSGVDSRVNSSNNNPRNEGRSVRLVKDVK